jgi:hypothetical protein
LVLQIERLPLKLLIVVEGFATEDLTAPLEILVDDWLRQSEAGDEDASHLEEDEWYHDNVVFGVEVEGVVTKPDFGLD